MNELTKDEIAVVLAALQSQQVRIRRDVGTNAHGLRRIEEIRRVIEKITKSGHVVPAATDSGPVEAFTLREDQPDLRATKRRSAR